MTDDRAKSHRTLLVADHLWETFAGMAVEMGADRDALINQALYTFARLNGFIADTPGSRTLALLADGRELDRVVKDRFLIGRGKHCDLIINSGKVSREHAAITREGSDYFIEDLGSSNGTWFDKRRISRRQIQEGDEYYICAEKLSCSFR